MHIKYSQCYYEIDRNRIGTEYTCSVPNQYDRYNAYPRENYLLKKRFHCKGQCLIENELWRRMMGSDEDNVEFGGGGGGVDYM